MILCAAGDPGGSRAVLPVAMELARRGESVRVLDHGFLGKEWSAEYAGMLVSPGDAEEALAACGAFLFGSSTNDTLPLSLARRAKERGKPIVHVLDNWSSYAERMKTDGAPPLEADVYAVMDETAKAGALAAGIPACSLAVTGHPGLAAGAEELRSFAAIDRAEAARGVGLPQGKLILAFVCEPFRQVFGADLDLPGHPGFTEETVLSAFASALAPYSEKVYSILLPHPKQTESEIDGLWRRSRGSLDGSVMLLPRSRDILPAIDGIAGMASLLLYEAWLGDIPVLSMQPNCRFDSLRRFALLEGIEYAGDTASVRSAATAWLVRCRSGWRMAPRPELDFHTTAPATIADRVLLLLREKGNS